MSIESPHPLYAANLERWTLCRDANSGQDVVKGKGRQYLKPTKGMLVDGMNEGETGKERYDAYLDRAVFPEVFADTINILVGILNRKPATIQVPTAMEPMLERATVLGESIDDLIRKIHEQQLIAARIGLHLDVPREQVQRAGMLPTMSIFYAEAIRNWDDGEELDPVKQTLNLVVLDVSENVRTGFEWDYINKYRVLTLGDFAVNEAEGVYRQGIFEEKQGFNEALMTTPLLRGRAFDEIPFVIIGPKDINIDPDLPPLLGLAQRSFAIYRGEADHRQALHITSEETLVTIGQLLQDANKVRVGTGARIAMSQGGDAKFIGPESRALQFQANNLQRDYDEAKALSARLSQGSSQVESGEALRIRVAAQTSNLASIASAAAAGVQESLRQAARWLGLNDQEVVVTPNLNFADDPLPFTELNEMLTFKQRGGVISYRTMSEVMESRDLTSRTLEEELEEIDKEKSTIPEEIANAFALSSMGAAGGPFEEGDDDDTEDDDAAGQDDPNEPDDE